jgi:hypothetical protein
VILGLFVAGLPVGVTVVIAVALLSFCVKPKPRKPRRP